MIRKLRTELKSITLMSMWIVAICFIITIFYNWGMRNRTVSKGKFSDILITVNNEPIEREELIILRNQLLQLYGDKIEEKQLINLVADQAIRRKLLLQEAKKNKIEVGNVEVIDYIKNFPQCQTGGKFDPKKYNEFIENFKENEIYFIEKVKEELLLEKLNNLILSSVKITKEEFFEDYKKKNEKINLKYLCFLPTDFTTEVKITEENLKQYYNTHKNEYITNNKVKVKYLLFDLDKIREKIKVTSEELFNYYEKNKEEYKKEGYREAEHILIKIKEDKNEAFKLAEQILSKAKVSSDFSEFGKKMEEKYKEKVKYETLPYIKPGDMVKPFEEAVFNMEKGELLDKIIETSFGYHIIKLNRIQEDYIEKFKLVKNQIEYKLVLEKSKKIAAEEARNFYKKIKKRTKNFETYALVFKEKYGIKLKETDFFEQEEMVKNLGQYKEFNEAAFKIRKIGKISSPINIPYKGWAVIQLIDQKPPYVKSFQEAKKYLESNFKEEKMKELARFKAEEILKALKVEPWDKVIKSYNLKEETQESVTYYNISKENMFLYNAFILNQGEISPVIETEKGFYIIKLINKEKIDLEKFKKEEDELFKDFLKQKQWQVLFQWEKSLKEKAKIIDYLR